jgi:trypsin
VLRAPLLAALALAAPLLAPAGAGAIVGGQPASVAGAPWLAQLDVGGRQACGATLVAPRAALTAAHCLLAFPDARRLRVVLGRQRLDRGPYAVVRRVTSVGIQPVYLRLQPDNRGDVALLFWDRPVTGVPVLPLADAASTPTAAGTPATVLGWGVRATGRPSPSLLRATLPLRSARSCRRAYRGIGVLPNSRYEVCAGATARRRPMACSGDSGGPLLVTGRDGVVRQLAVVSWGDGRDLCRRGARPGVFARLDTGPHRRWLDSALRAGRGRYRLPISRTAKLPPLGGLALRGWSDHFLSATHPL